MKALSNYIAFDLEFNTVKDVSHIIQVSAVKFCDHKEVDSFDTYVYSDVPLQSFINGLTGITADKLRDAPKLEAVLADFKTFVGYGLDLSSQYVLDVFDEAYERRSSDLNGIANLKLHTVAKFLEIDGKSHDSLEDARMTALVYERFLEFDDNKAFLTQQEPQDTTNPFASLSGLSHFFDE